MKLTYSLVRFMFAVVGVLAYGCGPQLANSPGRPTVYEDVESPGRVSGVGFESQDLVSITDHAMRDMLGTPLLANQGHPPRVIVDAQYFTNESSNRLDRNMITDLLRVELNRAAQGRMIFVGREYSGMVESERALKRSGAVDSASKTGTAAPAGADYRLGGRITTLDAIHTSSGMASRYHQIVLEMVDLETGVIVWNGGYKFKKSASDDVIYR